MNGSRNATASTATAAAAAVRASTDSTTAAAVGRRAQDQAGVQVTAFPAAAGVRGAGGVRGIGDTHDGYAGC